MPSAHPGQGSGEVPLPGHGQRRAAHSGNEREQGPQTCGGCAGLNQRAAGAEAGKGYGVQQGRHGSSQPPRGQVPQQQDGESQVDHEGSGQCGQYRPRNGTGGIFDFLAQCGDPGVPGKGEEHQPGGREDSPGAAGAFRRHARLRMGAQQARNRDKHQGGENNAEQDPGQQRCAGDTHEVDCREHCYGCNGHGRGVVRGHVVAKSQGHGRARCCLPGDKTPAGNKSRPFAQLFPAVNVGASAGRVFGGQLGGGNGIAVGNRAGDEHGSDHEPAGQCGGRGEDDEHAGAEH
ncbi:hypothetical protein D9M72_350620 [compost metagenome]